MLEKIEALPPHVFGVRASGDVSGKDIIDVLLPGLEKLSSQYGEIHYLLILNTPVNDFNVNAWFQNMVTGMKHLHEWKKMAIVTDEENVHTFTDMASKLIPGVAKGFSHTDVGTAVAWLSTKPSGKRSLQKLALVTLSAVLAAGLIYCSLVKKTN
ncbi:STAS/SEC14 domain-containing protein [Olivibacter sp. XZL3]|uniref:STAS/SEC14 domain-containing protein n=1 Tax=Olivibacter sp. XZL3 TaxID=1735116 RepID=UPI001066C98F|nr:STAS/SEC14 domain-containing protein [Olivibacter sp. XZL3]